MMRPVGPGIRRPLAEKESRFRFSCPCGEQGAALIEVLVALLILGLVASAFLGAISTSYRATTIDYEQTVAESLTRTQFESIKNSPYIDYSVAGRFPEEYGKVLRPTGYDLSLTVEPVMPDSHAPFTLVSVPPEPDTYDQDLGLQKITVEILYQGKVVMTTENYKARR